jgi:hypothetical protein
MADRYRLAEHADGGWSVVDELTGGPVVINGVMLYRLELEDAEDLADALTFQDARLLAKLEAIAKAPRQLD